MLIYVVEKLKLIIGLNPKVGTTTIFTILLKKLGHEITADVHTILSTHNTKIGKYDILHYDPKLNNLDINNYTKICIVRNPYERLISGIRQRSIDLCNYKDLSQNTITMFLQNLKQYNYIDQHFSPQSKDINNLKFDHVIDIKEMSKLFTLLHLEYKNENYGNNSTKYNTNNKINYHNLTIKDIVDRYDDIWSNDINSWFTKNDIKLINELYKEDFIFLNNYGHNFKIN
jgi:hypothetical protein